MILIPKMVSWRQKYIGLIKALITENKSFAIIAVIMLTTGAVGLVSINNVSKITSDIFFRNVQPSEKISEINRLMGVYRLKVYQQIASIETDEWLKIDLELRQKIIDKKFQDQSPLFLTAQEKRDFDELSRLWTELKKSYQAILELSFNYAKEEALEAVSGENLELSKLREATAENLISSKSQGIEEAYHSSQSIKTWNVMVTSTVFIVGIFICLVIVKQFNRKIRKYTHELEELNLSLESKVVKRTEEVAQKSDLLTAVLDSIQQGLIAYDQNLKLIASNKSFQHIRDVPPELLQEGTPFSELMSYDVKRGEFGDGDPERQLQEKLAIAERFEEHQIERERPDGTIIEIKGGPLPAGGFVSTFTDITERKKSEREILKNRKDLAKQATELGKALDQLESVNSVIMRWDADGTIIALNKFGLDLFGFSEQEVVGHSIVGTLVPDEREIGDYIRNMVVDILHDPEKYAENENEIYTKDGTCLWILWRNMPIRDGEGNLEEILSIGMDITEQKKLELEVAKAKDRMEQELQVGADIQMSMIPLTFPRFPEHKDIDVWAKLRPAREVGGDFYDFFFIDERLFAFVIADVSGKGVPAALLMAVAKTLLKSHAQDLRSTAKIVELTNNELSQNNEDCMFLTAFFGILDTKTGEMTYTNAGHNPPYLLSPDGSQKSLAEVHGPMIGAMEGITYDQAEIVLGVDDKLVLYTDGITEAFNGDGQDFGEERLSEMLERSGKLGTKHLVYALVQEVDGFVGNAEQSDDITVFCLRYVAWEGRDDKAQIELHLVNEIAEIERCLEALREFCDRFGLPPEVRNDVGVVLDDLLNNIISYGFEDEDEHLIEVSLAPDKQRFIVTISDDGVEFNPFLSSDPDIESDINERQIGGLGIHLVRSLMDDFSYQRIDGRNVVILMKRMGK